MGRAPCCDKANVKKGPWSPEEDAKLKAYIEQHGTGGNWIALPQKVGLKRCGKSCRLRWLNYLRPNIKHGGFSEEEDNIICSLYVSIGSRWSIIAAQLPGRTDNDIKNYWNTRLKKKLLGKRKEYQARRLISAASKQEAKDVQRRYADSNHVLYQPQGVQHIIGTPYGNLGPAIVGPQEFLEQTGPACHLTMPHNSPTPDHSARFMIDLSEEHLDQEISDNSCLKKMLHRLEGTLIDRSASINNNNIILASSQIPTPNVNAYQQIPQSVNNLDVGQAIISSESAAPPYARCMDNTNLKSMASALVDQNESISLGFSSPSSMQTLRDGCSSPEGNYQSVMWMNGINPGQNANNINSGYEFLMDLNDLLFCNNNNTLPLQRDTEANYCSAVNTYMDALADSCLNPQLPSDPRLSSSSCSPIYPYIPPSESGSQQEIFQEEAAFGL